MINRRDFLLSATALSGVLASCQRQSTSEVPDHFHIENLGLGLFTIPYLLEEDFAGTLAMVSEIGYKELEFFGPYPFSAPEAHEYWAPIATILGMKKTGYFGLPVAQVRAIMDQHGLSSPSMHIDLQTLRTRLDDAAEAAQAMGQQYMGLPAIPVEERPNLDGYKRIADEFNSMGQKLAPYGVRLLYHNHGYGLTEMEGEIPFNVLIERTDPELVALEMDLYWITAGHADPVAYLDAYPGRFPLLHVKDMTEAVRFEGDGSTPDQWIALQGYMTHAGNGVLDLHRILDHARRAGAQHFYLEQDLVQNPAEALQKSYDYLTALEFTS